MIRLFTVFGDSSFSLLALYPSIRGPHFVEAQAAQRRNEVQVADHPLRRSLGRLVVRLGVLLDEVRGERRDRR
jgi:hypothetical protein